MLCLGTAKSDRHSHHYQLLYNFVSCTKWRSHDVFPCVSLFNPLSPLLCKSDFIIWLGQLLMWTQMTLTVAEVFFFLILIDGKHKKCSVYNVHSVAFGISGRHACSQGSAPTIGSFLSPSELSLHCHSLFYFHSLLETSTQHKNTVLIWPLYGNGPVIGAVMLHIALLNAYMGVILPHPEDILQKTIR